MLVGTNQAEVCFDARTHQSCKIAAGGRTIGRNDRMIHQHISLRSENPAAGAGGYIRSDGCVHERNDVIARCTDPAPPPSPSAWFPDSVVLSVSNSVIAVFE